MSTTAISHVKDALEAVRSAPLPEPADFLGIERDEVRSSERADFSAPTRQVVAVGSQMVEFDDAFPPDLRPDVANGFLFAQLAADRASMDPTGQRGPDPKLWYDVYVATLLNVGWFIQGQEAVEHDISSAIGQVHKEIVPVLTAALGPAGASALVITLLNGLHNMDADRPWITVFDRSTQRASAAQFQISYTTLADETPSASLVSFDLRADHRVTQVLFFKLSGSNATLRHLSSSLSLNRDVFDAVKAIVAERVTPFAAARIAEIPIGG